MWITGRVQRTIAIGRGAPHPYAAPAGAATPPRGASAHATQTVDRGPRPPGHSLRPGRGCPGPTAAVPRDRPAAQTPGRGGGAGTARAAQARPVLPEAR